jgi:hypothetical protein
LVHRGLAAAVLALVFLSGASCGIRDDSGTEPPLPVAPPPRSVPVTPTVIGDPAGCPLPEIRPVIERDIPMADGVRVVELQVRACRNDYAEVVVLAENSGVADPLPVYLHRTGDSWSIVDWGGHIECSDPDSTPDRTLAACRALGR